MEKSEASSSEAEEGRPNCRLRDARTRRFWTIKQAAAKAEVSETTYTRWEHGQQDPHLINISRLCALFEVTPKALGFEHIVKEEEPSGRVEKADDLASQHVQRVNERLRLEVLTAREKIEYLTSENKQVRAERRLEQERRQVAYGRLHDAEERIRSLEVQLQAARSQLGDRTTTAPLRKRVESALSVLPEPD